MRLASSGALAWVTSCLVGLVFVGVACGLSSSSDNGGAGGAGGAGGSSAGGITLCRTSAECSGGKVCSGAGTRSIKSLQSDCASQCTTGCSSPDIPASDRQSCIDACTQVCAIFGSLDSTAGILTGLGDAGIFTTSGAGGTSSLTTSGAGGFSGSPTGICVAATGTTGTGGGGGAGGGWERLGAGRSR